MKNLTKLFYLFILTFGLAVPVHAQSDYSQTGTFYFCKNISDDVQPIEPVTEISAGTPVYFLFKMDSPMLGPKDGSLFTVGWVINLIGDDGAYKDKMDEYMTGFEKGNRRFCTDVPYTFTKPGKYRVYVIDWYDSRRNYYGGDYEKYWAMGEITVK
jgi:hypothetical protein